MTSIGEEAFYDCDGLTSITIPENSQLTSIGNGAFKDCDGLTSITISEGVTSIEWGAFYNCSSLTSITLSENSQLTSIGGYAFYNCSSLTSITLPDGVTSIGEKAFYDCANLCKVFNNSSLSLSKGSSSNGYVAYYAKVIYQGGKPTTIGDFQFYTSEGIHSLVNYIGNDTEVVLPDSYNGESYEIGIAAFRGCDGLTAINIPEGVTSIGDYAFSNCDGLTSIVIPKGVTSIGSDAFSGCSSFEQVTINCANVGNWFGGNSSIKEVVLGEGVTSIGYGAFSGCTGLTSIVVLAGNSVYDSRGGCNAIIVTSCDSLIQGCSSTIIPESVTSIGNYAFDGCSSLTAITIPESVTSIGDYAFRDCSILTSITLPDGVTSIGSGAFEDCSRLTSITLPDGVTSIGYYAFRECSSLTAISIPENSQLTSIGDYAFQDCSSLTSITLPASVTSIGDDIGRSCGVFSNCTSLKEVIFEDGTETLAVGCDYFNRSPRIPGRGLFYDCPLEKVYLGRNLNYDTSSKAGYSPFYDKGTLTSLIIGPEVTEVGEYAFSGCGLDSITCYAMVPPTCYASTFSGVDTSIPVYVSETSVADYQSAEVWKDFLGFVGVDTGIDNSQFTIDNSQLTIYDLHGRRITDTEGLKGIYIVGGRKVVFK